MQAISALEPKAYLLWATWRTRISWRPQTLLRAVLRHLPRKLPIGSAWAAGHFQSSLTSHNSSQERREAKTQTSPVTSWDASQQLIRWFRNTPQHGLPCDLCDMQGLSCRKAVNHVRRRINGKEWLSVDGHYLEARLSVQAATEPTYTKPLSWEI